MLPSMIYFKMCCNCFDCHKISWQLSFKWFSSLTLLAPIWFIETLKLKYRLFSKVGWPAVVETRFGSCFVILRT